MGRRPEPSLVHTESSTPTLASRIEATDERTKREVPARSARAALHRCGVAAVERADEMHAHDSPEEGVIAVLSCGCAHGGLAFEVET